VNTIVTLPTLNDSDIHPSDRQVELDIVRCHQYLDLISCDTGQSKLKHILRIWIRRQDALEYWQGLDSMAVPFLMLYYEQEVR
jgi:TBC domain-containing protein kinase-like protein